MRRQWIFRLLILPGYLADKYDVTAEESIDRANERVKKSTEQAFAETVIGYETVTAENTSVQFHGGKARYALYPVWLLNTTWNGNRYTFAMTDRPENLVGDLPVDKSAATRWTAYTGGCVYCSNLRCCNTSSFIRTVLGGDENEKENDITFAYSGPVSGYDNFSFSR